MAGTVTVELKPQKGGWITFITIELDQIVDPNKSAYLNIEYATDLGCELPRAEMRVRIGQTLGPYSLASVPQPTQMFSCPV